jgi:hypothetical protein
MKNTRYRLKTRVGTENAGRGLETRNNAHKREVVLGNEECLLVEVGNS